MLKSCLQLSEKTQLILIKFTFIRMFPMRVEWSYLTVRECQQMQLQVWLSAQVKVTGPHTLLLYSDVFHLPNQNSRQKVQGGTGGTQHARGTAWHWSCRCLGAWLVTPRSHTLPQGSVSFHPHSVLVMMCFIVTTPHWWISVQPPCLQVWCIDIHVNPAQATPQGRPESKVNQKLAPVTRSPVLWV